MSQNCIYLTGLNGEPNVCPKEVYISMGIVLVFVFQEILPLLLCLIKIFLVFLLLKLISLSMLMKASRQLVLQDPITRTIINGYHISIYFL